MSFGGRGFLQRAVLVINWKLKNKHYVLVFVKMACVSSLLVPVLMGDCLIWISSAFLELPPDISGAQMELWHKGMVSQDQISFWDGAGVLSPSPRTRNRAVLCLPLEWGAVLGPCLLQGASVTLVLLFHLGWHWAPLEGLPLGDGELGCLCSFALAWPGYPQSLFPCVGVCYAT